MGLNSDYWWFNNPVDNISQKLLQLCLATIEHVTKFLWDYK